MNFARISRISSFELLYFLRYFFISTTHCFAAISLPHDIPHTHKHQTHTNASDIGGLFFYVGSSGIFCALVHSKKNEKKFSLRILLEILLHQNRFSKNILRRKSFRIKIFPGKFPPLPIINKKHWKKNSFGYDKTLVITVFYGLFVFGGDHHE